MKRPQNTIYTLYVMNLRDLSISFLEIRRLILSLDLLAIAREKIFPVLSFAFLAGGGVILAGMLSDVFVT